jgi:ferritin-like metal-binding protein YciE
LVLVERRRSDQASRALRRNLPVDPAGEEKLRMDTVKMEKDVLFTRWMNEAYRMETAIMPILERHISDAEGHSDLQAKLQAHLHATHHHADLVRSCLERLGKPAPADHATPTPPSDEPIAATGRGSGVHDAANGGNGDGDVVANGGSGELLIKDGLDGYSTEQYEVATYKALITAARDLGQMECERAFEEILNDEQEMADWLDINLPLLVEQTIRHAA